MAGGVRFKHDAHQRIAAKIALDASGKIQVFRGTGVPAANFFQKSGAENTKCAGHVVHHIEFTQRYFRQMNGQHVFDGLQPGNDTGFGVAYAQIASHRHHVRVMEMPHRRAHHNIVERSIAVQRHDDFAAVQLEYRIQRRNAATALAFGHDHQRTVGVLRHIILHFHHRFGGFMVLDGAVDNHQDLDMPRVDLLHQRTNG